MKSFAYYVLSCAPGGLVGALLANSGLTVSDWQFWAWLVSFGVVMAFRDVSRADK